MNAIAMKRAARDPTLESPSAPVARVDDPAAFRAMVLEHAPHLRRLVRSLGVPEPDLDDVSQEVFIVAHRRLQTFEGRSALRTWLCGIAVRVASDFRAKGYRRREQPTDNPPAEAQNADQELALERKRAWLLIEGLLGELSQEQREVFVLYELGELSMPEVARALECPQPTAYSRLYAAREQIERRMAQLRLTERTP